MISHFLFAVLAASAVPEVCPANCPCHKPLPAFAAMPNFVVAPVFSPVRFTGLVVVSADWCVPCHELAARAKVLAAKGEPITVQIDNDGSRYGVRAWPMVIAYRRGAEVERRPGAVSDDVLRELLVKVKPNSMPQKH